MPDRYTMQISRLTIDKLGIKLYDKVSAVLAELISNAYDADAELVAISAPLNQYLATTEDKKVVDRGLEIVVEDDGHGMSPDEVNEHYLRVGIDRRVRGQYSRGKSRPVMGRKGIGKLAPFGICEEIEVITTGGTRGADGLYETAHLVLHLSAVMSDTDEDYHPQVGQHDGTRRPQTGTKVILRRFQRRKVPDAETLNRQLAARFGISRDDWLVEIADSADPTGVFEIGELPIETLEGTRIDLSGRPGPVVDGVEMPIRGWVAYAREPYKDDAMAGVRIFARGKLVAQTRDFDIRPGFTGEFKLRSYVVGELHADWLDEGEDLIRSDRQDILWNSELGEALSAWGQRLVAELARSAEVQVSSHVWEEFLERSDIEQRLSQTTGDKRFHKSVLDAAKLLVRRNDREAIRVDADYVAAVTQLAFAIGPHRDLMMALTAAAASNDTTLKAVVQLFAKAGMAERYSLGQVASERIGAVNQLKRLITSPDTVERELQRLLEGAPWLISPDWTPLTMDQQLRRLRDTFESWYERVYGKTIITSAIAYPTKRPDFVMIANDAFIDVLEIKRTAHEMTDEEYRRAYRYLDVIAKFLAENQKIAERFSGGVRLTLVCDGIALKDPIYRKQLDDDDRITHRTWHEMLDATIKAHQDFLTEVWESADTVESDESTGSRIAEASEGPALRRAEPMDSE